MTPDQIAQQAMSLRDNEAFQQALTARRAEALEKLATMKRDDEETFHSCQAMVRLVDDIQADLKRFIREGQPKKPPGLA